MVNLVAGREVVVELLQERATPQALAYEALELVSESSVAAERQRAAFREIRQRLGPPGAARRVADLLAAMV